MHEFKVLASSSSPEQLARLLKTEDFERYGEPFTPEFVYEAIRQLSRFASMRVSTVIVDHTVDADKTSADISKMPRSSWAFFYSRWMMSAVIS